MIPFILFIDTLKFKGFIGVPKHLDKIKYLYIHKNNTYFKTENNS